MYTEPAVNSVATFLGLSRPINSFPLHVAAAVPNLNIQLEPVAANRKLQLAAFSTGFIGGFALSALYASILKGSHHAHNANDTFTPVQWLEYPADYISPAMDLFSDDQAPLGVSSPQSCPKDSEHLERTFDLLCYKHLSMKLGIPSVVDQDTTLAVLLRTLGNTSSDSSAVFSSLSAVDASSTQGGSQQNSGSGRTGGDQNDYYESRPSFPKTGCIIAIPMNSTFSSRLPPACDEECTGDPQSDWTGIGTASIVIAITVFGLLSKHRRSVLPPATPAPPSEPSTITSGDFDGDVDHNLSQGNYVCNDQPSARLVVALLDDVNPSFEQLFEYGLLDSYTPYVALVFFDKYWDARSDVGLPEDGSAPDGFAARFDALQDALPSLQEFQRMAETLPLDLARFVLFWVAIIVCFVLRVIGFFVTGRFGRRGIRRLMKQLKNGKRSVATPALIPHSIENETQTVDSNLVVKTIGDEIVDRSTTDPSIVDDDTHQADWVIMPQASPFPSTSSVALVDETVETNLAPVDNEHKAEAEDDGKGWKLVSRRKGKGKATAEDDAHAKMVETVVEPLVESSTPSSRDALPFMPRLRGSRGHGRGRGPRPTVAAPP